MPPGIGPGRETLTTELRTSTVHAGSRRKLPDQPNSHAAGPVIGGEVVSVTGTHESRCAEPGAPAKLVLGAVAVRARRAVDRRALVVLVPAILGPLKDIPQHVVQAECAGFERADGRGVDIAIIAAEYGPAGIPACRALVGHVRARARARSVRTPRLIGIAAGARGIFPFRCARQPVPMPGLRRQPSRVGFGIVPGRAGDGMRSGLHEAGILPTAFGPMLPLTVVDIAALHVPPGRRDEGTEFIQGDGTRGHGERTPDGHPVQRLLEGSGATVGAGRSLLESPLRQYRQARTRRAVADDRAGFRQISS